MTRAGSPAPLYLDTSAVLRAALESGTTPEIEERISTAPLLITSRLSLVEASRALLRVRSMGSVPEARLADVTRDITRLWLRCDIWEVSRSVCELAAHVAPATRLRALVALHLATFLLAREAIAGLELLTADERLREAAGG